MRKAFWEGFYKASVILNPFVILAVGVYHTCKSIASDKVKNIKVVG